MLCLTSMFIFINIEVYANNVQSAVKSLQERVNKSVEEKNNTQDTCNQAKEYYLNAIQQEPLKSMIDKIPNNIVLNGTTHYFDEINKSQDEFIFFKISYIADWNAEGDVPYYINNSGDKVVKQTAFAAMFNIEGVRQDYGVILWFDGDIRKPLAIYQLTPKQCAQNWRRSKAKFCSFFSDACWLDTKEGWKFKEEDENCVKWRNRYIKNGYNYCDPQASFPVNYSTMYFCGSYLTGISERHSPSQSTWHDGVSCVEDSTKIYCSGLFAIPAEIAINNCISQFELPDPYEDDSDEYYYNFVLPKISKALVIKH